MRRLRPTHLRLVEAPTLTPQELRLQRDLVELSERLSAKRQERRDEGAAQAHLYSSRARERGNNVIPLGRHISPDPGRPAA